MRAENSQSFNVFPIGIVKDSETKGIKEIHLFEEFEPGLEGIEECLHLIILFWLHRLEEKRGALQFKKRGALQFRPHLKSLVPPGKDVALDTHGVFCSRAPIRPNPIGLTVVGLVERRGNILKVKGLDALDGTPVLDIKAYFLA